MSLRPRVATDWPQNRRQHPHNTQRRHHLVRGGGTAAMAKESWLPRDTTSAFDNEFGHMRVVPRDDDDFKATSYHKRKAEEEEDGDSQGI